MEQHIIVKNTDRYSFEGEFPAKFFVTGISLAQAILLAEKLSNHEVGCDYAYYCEGDPDAM